MPRIRLVVVAMGAALQAGCVAGARRWGDPAKGAYVAYAPQIAIALALESPQPREGNLARQIAIFSAVARSGAKGDIAGIQLLSTGKASVWSSELTGDKHAVGRWRREGDLVFLSVEGRETQAKLTAQGVVLSTWPCDDPEIQQLAALRPLLLLKMGR
jgi:hypothetical protein